ncbi:hypothetical protein GCM10010330_80020 [Streptomyces tendae]|nr:hypothetical protein GCM10010330_80020 [Streptomyces tendae]
MAGLWRKVLSVLCDDSVDQRERERILASGAARLAAVRASGGGMATAEDVVRIAMEEFAVLLDTSTARAALRECHDCEW